MSKSLRTNHYYKMKRIVILILFTLALISCTDDSFDSQSNRASEAYNSWKSLGINSYTMDQQRVGNFNLSGMILKIGVTNSTITSIQDTSGTVQITRGDWSNYKTIDQLFDILTKLNTIRPSSFNVIYHETYHYPVSVYIDARSSSLGEVYNFTIQNLVPIR